MYPATEGPPTKVESPGISSGLCGASRPQFFSGVCSVVLRLFNIIQPDVAVFGEKDYQQFLVIEKMVRDLHLDIKVIPGPIVRESDGLAMSSRNARLSKDDRIAASLIPRAFKLAKEYISNGGNNISKAREIFAEIVLSSPRMKIDYIEILNSENLGSLEELEGEILIAVAIFCGEVRLIDNIRLTIP